MCSVLQYNLLEDVIVCIGQLFLEESVLLLMLEAEEGQEGSPENQTRQL